MRPNESRMEELVKYIVKSLVDYPEQVEVHKIEGDKTTILELKVATPDLGKVIGKQGRIAQAMRTVIRAAAAKMNKRAVLEILE